MRRLGCQKPRAIERLQKSKQLQFASRGKLKPARLAGKQQGRGRRFETLLQRLVVGRFSQCTTMSAAGRPTPANRDREDAKVARLLKRVLVLAVLAAVGGAVVYVTVMPAVQKQAAGRRAKMLADAPVPVIDAPARIADVPVYLNGVGTAKARNTVTVRPQVDGKILEHQVQGGPGGQARRRAGADRSRHLSGPARPGDGQEGAR